jgi:hypothetical protein
MCSPAIPYGYRQDISVSVTAGGAHAPNEYYVIESSNPKLQGIDGATRSYVEFLYELGRQA